MRRRIRAVVLRQASLGLLATGVLLFCVSCDGGDVTTPSAGSLAITTATTGPDPNPDGYTVTVDDGAEIPVGANATLQRDNLEAGDHSVRLTGIAANCTVAGENPRTVAIAAGETTTVSFTVTCAAGTGSIEITTTTIGTSPDPDGYTITVDNGAPQTIAASSSLTVAAVGPGTREVTLAGLAPNCAVQGDNPQSVSVTAGTTAGVAFTISCSAISVLKTAFIVYESEDGPGNVYVGNPDGSRRRLTNDLDYSQLDWSPDGERIAASGRLFSSDAHDVYVINADGSGKTKLTNNPEMDNAGIAGGACPAWSPDGREIAFNRLGIDNRNDIYVMNSDGSGLANLTNHTGNEGCPFWSPDGNKIAFVSDSDEFGYYGEFDIYVMNADGSGATNLTRNTFWQDHIAWSPDGRQIAYTGHRLGDPNPYNIYVTNADGSGESNLFRVVAQVGSSGHPLWSPNGRQIAFTSCAILGCEVYTMNADGSGQRNLTNSLENAEGAISWSPDGNQILFSRSTDTDGGLWVMDQDGTGRTRLAQSVGSETSIWWR